MKKSGDKSIIKRSIFTCLILIFVAASIRISAHNDDSLSMVPLNQHRQYATHDPHLGMMTLWHSDGRPLRMFEVPDTFRLSTFAFSDRHFKIVSGNVTPFEWISIGDYDAMTYRYASMGKRRKHIDYISNASPQVPEVFKGIGDLDRVVNTDNITLMWEELTTENHHISYQQILTQVTGNTWDITEDRLDASVSSVNISTLGGRYIIRRIHTSGGFRDSDGESSDANEGDPRLAFSVSVDKTPPSFQTPPSLTVSSNHLGRDVQHVIFHPNEDVLAHFHVTTQSGDDYFYSKTAHSPTESRVSWDGRNMQNVPNDGDYQLRLYLEDMATNTSNVVTWNVVYDAYPPILTPSPSYPLFLSPNDDGLFDDAEVSVEVNEAVDMTVVLTPLAEENGVTLSRTFVTENHTQNINRAMFPSLEDGPYMLQWNAVDKKGLEGSAAVTINIDTSPPVISFVNTGYHVAGKNDELLVILQSSEAVNVTASIPIIPETSQPLPMDVQIRQVTASIAAGTSNIQIFPIHGDDGSYPLTVVASDHVGNARHIRTKVIIDRHGPTLEDIRLDPEIVNLNHASLLHVTANDPHMTDATMTVTLERRGSGQSLTLSDSQPYRPTLNISELINNTIPVFYDGIYTLSVHLSDTWANVSTASIDVPIGKKAVDLTISPIGPISFQKMDKAALSFRVVNDFMPDIQHIRSYIIHPETNEKWRILDEGPLSIGNHERHMPIEELKDIHDGLYDVYVEMTSIVGELSTENTIIDIDHLSPIISDLSVSHSTFNYGTSLTVSGRVSDRHLDMQSMSAEINDLPIYGEWTIDANQFIFNTDGRINDKPLNDGRYELKITALDRAGNIGHETIMIAIDTTAPIITDLMLSAARLTYSNDSMPDPLEIKVESNEAVISHAVIRNQSNETVFSHRLAKASTTSHFFWDGKENGVFNDATYTLTIYMIDAAGNKTESAPVAVEVRNSDATINNLRIYPEKVSPKHPFQILFNSTISGFLDAVIIDNNGKIIRQLAKKEAIVDGENSLTFSIGDSVISDGTYRLLLTHFDEIGVLSDLQRSMDIDGTPPLLSDIRLSHSTISVDTWNEIRMTVSTYEDGQLQWILITDDGLSVPISDLMPIAEGEQSITLEHGDVRPELREGRYKITAVMTDIAGNTAERYQELTVLKASDIDMVPLQSVWIFTPNNDAVNDTLDMSMSLFGNGELNVELSIRNDVGTVIYRYSPHVIQSGDTLQVSWDGRDERYRHVADGNYTLFVDITDALGNIKEVTHPIYLISTPIRFRNIAYNSDHFRFEDDRSRLQFYADISYPLTVLQAEEIEQSSRVKMQIKQHNKVVFEDIYSVTQEVLIHYNGEGLVEGPFELHMSGEDIWRIPIEPIKKEFMFDKTVPDMPVVLSMFDADNVLDNSSNLVVQTTTFSSTFNVNNIGMTVMSDGADMMMLRDADGHVRAVATTNTNIFTIPKLTFSEGDHTIYLQSSDMAGNMSDIQMIGIHIDQTAPYVSTAHVTIDSPISSDDHLTRLGSGRYQLNIQMSEDVDLDRRSSIFLTNGSYQIPLTSISVNKQLVRGVFDVLGTDKNGEYSLIISQLSDTAGNHVMLNPDINIHVDTIPPDAPALELGKPIINTPVFTDSIRLSQDTESIDIILDDRPRTIVRPTSNRLPMTYDVDDGTHTLQLIARDAVGNTSDPVVYHFRVDRHAPKLQFSSIADASVLSSGVHSLFIEFDDELLPSSATDIRFDHMDGTHSLDISNIQVDGNRLRLEINISETTPNGPYQLSMGKLTDIAGNEADQLQTMMLNVDTKAPAAPILHDPQLLSKEEKVALNVVSESNTMIVVLADDQVLESWPHKSDTSHRMIDLVEGQNKITLYAYDEAGNRSDALTHIFYVDTIAPTLISESISDRNAFAAGTYQGYLEFDEDISLSSGSHIVLKNDRSEYPVTITNVDGRRLTMTLVIPLSAIQGEYRLHLRNINDNAGNRVTVNGLHMYTIDTTIPRRPEWSGLPDTTNALTVTGSIMSDPDAKLLLYVDDKRVESFDMGHRHHSVALTLDEGIHKLTLLSVDKAGNRSLPLTHSLIVDRTSPSIQSLDVSEKIVSDNVFRVVLRFDEDIDVNIHPNVILRNEKGDERPIQQLRFNDTEWVAEGHFYPGDNGSGFLNIEGVYDRAGNMLQSQAIRIIEIDTEPPMRPQFIDLPERSNMHQMPVTINADVGSGVRIDIDGKPALEYIQESPQYSVKLTLSEGDRQLRIISKDKANNTSQSDIYSLRVDLTHPRIEAHSIGNRTHLRTGAYPLTITMSEALDTDREPLLRLISPTQSIDVAITKVEGRQIVGEILVSDGMDGRYELHISNAYDLAGNHRHITPLSMYIDTKTPKKPFFIDPPTMTNKTDIILYLDGEIGSMATIIANGNVSYNGNITRREQRIPLTLTHGSMTLYASSVDAAGNRSEEYRHDIQVDHIPPSLLSTSIHGLNVLKQGVYEVLINASEPVRHDDDIELMLRSDTSFIPISIDHIDDTKIMGVVSIENGINGEFRLQLKDMSDIAGNRITLESDETYTIDTLPPMIPDINGVPELSNESVIDSVIRAEIGSRVIIKNNGVILAELDQDQASITHSFALSEGKHHLIFQSQDAAGNISTSAQYESTIDMTAPDIAPIRHVPEAVVSANTYTFEIDILEEIDTRYIPNIMVITAGDAVRSAENILLTETKIQGNITFLPGDDGMSEWQINGLTDRAGNIRQVITRSAWYVDTIAPSPPSFLNAPNITNDPNSHLNIQADIGSRVDVYVNDRLVESREQTRTIERYTLSLSEGISEIMAIATDAVGNSSDVSTHAIVLDTRPPSVIRHAISESGLSILKTGTYPVTVHTSEEIDDAELPILRLVQGEHIIPIIIESIDTDTISGRVTIPDGHNGDYRLHVEELRDRAGNVQTYPLPELYRIDTMPPHIQFDSIPLSNSHADPFYVNVKSSESDTTLYYSLDGVSYPPIESTNTLSTLALSLSIGTHVIAIHSVDAAGNVSNLLNHQVIIDRTLPKLLDVVMVSDSPAGMGDVVTKLTFNESLSETPDVRLIASDGHEFVTTLSNNDGAKVYTFRSRITSGHDGESRLHVSAVDMAGNRTPDSDYSHYLIDTVAPKVTRVEWRDDKAISGGGREITVALELSETVSPIIAFHLDDESYPGTYANGIARIRIPSGVQGEGTLSISHLIDAAGNKGNDDTHLTRNIDSVIPNGDVLDIDADTNTGTVSELRVNLAFNEPIQSDILDISLRDTKSRSLSLKPSKVTFSEDRQRAMAMFDIKAIEDRLFLDLKQLTDDKGNSRPLKTLSLGMVDTIAPTITDVKATMFEFSAIRNVGTSNVQISYRIDDPLADIAARIYDTSGRLRRTFDHHMHVTHPEHSGDAIVQISWDGQDDNGKFLPAGWYVFRTWAVDTSSFENRSEINEGLFKINEQHLHLSGEPVRAAISLNARPWTIGYTFNDQHLVKPDEEKPDIGFLSLNVIGRITEEIYKKGPNGLDEKIAVLTQNRASTAFSRGSIGRWTGKRGNSASASVPYVESGDYYLKVTARTMKRDEVNAELIIPFVIDHDAPIFSNITIDDGPFTTHHQGKHRLDLSYTVNDNTATQVFTHPTIFGRHTESTAVTTGGQATYSVDLTSYSSIKDGSHSITLNATDSAGNHGSITIPIQMDSTPPRMDIYIPSQNIGYVSSDIHVDVTALVDVSTTRLQYGLNSSQNMSEHAYVSVSDVADGSHRVWVKATDAAGNYTLHSKEIILDRSAPPPAFNVQGPEHSEVGYTNQSEITITDIRINGEKYPHLIHVKGSHGDAKTYAFNDTISWVLTTSDNVHAVAIQSEDKAGNRSKWMEKTIILDQNAPTITSLSIPDTHTRFKNGIYYQMTAHYDPTKWLGSQNINPPSDYHPSRIIHHRRNIRTNDGYREVEQSFRIKDLAGNISPSYSSTVIIDTAAPEITSIEYSSEHRWVSANTLADIRVNHRDPSGDIIDYRILNHEGHEYRSWQPMPMLIEDGSFVLPIKTMSLDTGVWTVEFRLKDIFNRQSKTHSQIVRVDRHAPVIDTGITLRSTFISSQNYVILEPVNGQFATDDHSGIDAIYVGFSKNGPWQVIRPNHPQCSTAALRDGSTYPLYIKAVDRVGRETIKKMTDITIDRQAPIVMPLSVNGYVMPDKSRQYINVSINDIVVALAHKNETALTFDYYEMALDNDPWQQIIRDSSGTFKITADDIISRPSPFRLHVRAVDRAGNKSAVRTVELYDDDTPPTVKINSKERPISDGKIFVNFIDPPTLQLSFVGTDDSSDSIDRVTYELFRSLDNGQLTELTNGHIPVKSAHDIPLVFNRSDMPDQGHYVLTCHIIDHAGNRSETQQRIEIIVDDESPIIEWVDSPVSRIVRSQDPGNRISTYDDGQMIGRYKRFEDTNEAYPMAVHQIRIYSTYVKPGEPVVDVDLLDDDLKYQTDVKGYKVRWNGWLKDEGHQFKQLPQGYYLAEIEAIDQAGNRTVTSSVFHVDDDIFLGGEDPHTPSVEIRGKTVVKWGEGQRLEQELFLRANESDRGNDIDQGSRFFVTDLPQLVTFRYSKLIRHNQLTKLYLYRHRDTTTFPLLQSDHKIHGMYGDPGELVQEPEEIHNYQSQGTRDDILMVIKDVQLDPGYHRTFLWMDVAGKSHRTREYYRTVTRYDRYKYAAPGDDGIWKTRSIDYKTYRTHFYNSEAGNNNWRYFESPHDPSWVPLYHALSNNNRVTNENGLIMFRPDNKKSFVLSDERDYTAYVWEHPVSKLRKITQHQRSPGDGYVLKQSLRNQEEYGSGRTDYKQMAGIKDVSIYYDEASKLYHIAWIKTVEIADSEGSITTKDSVYYQFVYAENLDDDEFTQIRILNKPPESARTFNITAPKYTNGDDTIVTTSRPRFKWTVPSGNVSAATRYKIQLNKGYINGTEALPNFEVNERRINDDVQVITIPAGAYQFDGDTVTFRPQHSDSLGKTAATDAYQWQVWADWDGDRVWDDVSETSERFKVDPPLTIEASINYPNPFKSKTHIRYKLSKDAELVSIRIFDAAGRLVRIIHDAPTRGTRPYHEYNDVLWDGRNGRNDNVNNGVYIYKITATDAQGHRTSAKGKMIKLH